MGGCGCGESVEGQGEKSDLTADCVSPSLQCSPWLGHPRGNPLGVWRGAKVTLGARSSVALTLPKGCVVLVSSRRHLSCSSAVAQQWL